MITNNFSIKVIRISLDKSIIRGNNRYKHKKFIQRYINYYMYLWASKIIPSFCDRFRRLYTFNFI